MNKHLNALLATPLISALGNDAQQKIINLLAQQDEKVLRNFIISQVSNTDELSRQLIAHFGNRTEYSFDAALKQMIKTHRKEVKQERKAQSNRGLQERLAEDPLSLQGMILCIDKDEYEVLQVIEQPEVLGNNAESCWLLNLKNSAKFFYIIKIKCSAEQKLHFLKNTNL